MYCMVCHQYTSKTFRQVRGGIEIEAAFCGLHMPAEIEYRKSRENRSAYL